MSDSYLCEKCDYEVRVLEIDSNQHEYDAHRMDGAYWFPEDDAAMESGGAEHWCDGIVIEQTYDHPAEYCEMQVPAQGVRCYLHGGGLA